MSSAQQADQIHQYLAWCLPSKLTKYTSILHDVCPAHQYLAWCLPSKLTTPVPGMMSTQQADHTSTWHDVCPASWPIHQYLAWCLPSKLTTPVPGMMSAQQADHTSTWHDVCPASWPHQYLAWCLPSKLTNTPVPGMMLTQQADLIHQYLVVHHLCNISVWQPDQRKPSTCLTFMRMFFRYSRFCSSFSRCWFRYRRRISSFKTFICSLMRDTDSSLSFSNCKATEHKSTEFEGLWLTYFGEDQVKWFYNTHCTHIHTCNSFFSFFQAILLTVCMSGHMWKCVHVCLFFLKRVTNAIAYHHHHHY